MNQFYQKYRHQKYHFEEIEHLELILNLFNDKIDFNAFSGVEFSIL